MQNMMRTVLLAAILLFASTLSAQIIAVDTNKIGENPNAGHYYNGRGFSMYYETYGNGEPLLLIHGNGGSITNFLYQIPYFALRYKVIAPDSRAQGKSTDPGDSLSLAMMADDLNALLTSLHLDSCYVIGWSDGATEALLLAMHHPDKVKKLVVTGARLWSDTTSMDPTVYEWATNYIASFDHMKQTPDVENNRKVAKLLISQSRINPEELQQIQCPVMVVAGDHDIICLQHTVLIANSIPDSYLWIVPGSGNAILVDNTSMFNTIVNNFFSTPFKKLAGLDRFN
jgi:pimeloyl-ACP methyl ester carboxylesterase